MVRPWPAHRDREDVARVVLLKFQSPRRSPARRSESGLGVRAPPPLGRTLFLVVTSSGKVEVPGGVAHPQAATQRRLLRITEQARQLTHDPSDRRADQEPDPPLVGRAPASRAPTRYVASYSVPPATLRFAPPTHLDHLPPTRPPESRDGVGGNREVRVMRVLVVPHSAGVRDPALGATAEASLDGGRRRRAATMSAPGVARR